MDFSKPLDLQNYFAQQIALEQEFLVLNENQRDIVLALLATEHAVNEYDLRMRTYRRLIVERMGHTSTNDSARHDIDKKLEELGMEPIPYSGGREDEALEEYVNTLRQRLELKSNESFKDQEKFFRFLAGKFDVFLPSNVKFKSDLLHLKFEGFIKPKERDKPKRKEYSLNPEYFARWKRIRQSILQEIEKGNISLKCLTGASKEFWQIKES